jgi:hypothetical protein
MKDHVQITMGMDIAALRKSMDAAKSLVENAVAGMKKTFLALAGVVGVAFGFKAIAEGIGAAVRRGKELDMLARETGRTAEEIALLTEVVHRAELSMADAADIAKTLGENWREAQLGATQFAGQLNILGLSTEKLAKMSTPEQFATIAGAINKLRDPVMRAKLAYDLLGSSGHKAVANFQNGDLERAAQLMGRNAMAIAEARRHMARLNDAWNRLKRVGEVLFGGIASKVAPMLMVAAEKLESILPTVSDWAQRVGKFLVEAAAIVIQAFKEKKAMELLKLGVQAVMRSAGTYLMAAFKAALEFFSVVIQQVFGGGAIGTALKESFLAAVWAIPKAWAEVQVTIAAGLMTAVETAFNLAPKILATAAENFSTIIMSFMPWWAKAIKGLYKMFKEGKISFDFDAMIEKGKKAVGAVSSWLKGNADSDEMSIGQRFKKNYDFVKAVSPIGWIAEYAGKKFEEHVKAAVAAFKDADYSKAFDDAVAKFKKTVGEDPFKSKEAWEKFQKLNKQLLANFKMPVLGKESGEYSKGPTVKGMLGGEGSYDEFRRVGGGVSGAITNIQQKMYDKLAAIANSAAQQVTATQQLVSRFNGGNPSTEMPGVR